MRVVAGLLVTMALAVVAWAEEPPATTITPTSLPTPTTRVPRPAPGRSLQGMPTGLPGFGVPGEQPSQRPATEKPAGNAVP